ncbi:MAG: glycosyltransferase [Candidatus Pacebacteria bacterium]|nr:glycosyltransferase [Candidatus Paceibacterota bacterium]
MKILFLTQLLPWPTNHGGKFKTLQLLKNLALEHRIYLACFISQKSDLEYLSELKRYCREIKVILVPTTNSRYKEIPGQVMAWFFSLKPVIVCQYRNQAMADYLKRLINREIFDFVYLEHLSLVQYADCFPASRNFKLVYGEHNIAWLSRWRLAKISRNVFKKIFFLVETVKLYFYEKRKLKVFDCCLAISQFDRKRLMELGLKNTEVKVLPTAFKIRPVWRPQNFRQPKILFLGLLSWEPNRDGFWWFYREIWPLVLEKLPQAVFWVIGDEATTKMKEAAAEDSRLELFGFVKNLTVYLAQSSVLVAPVRTGSGLRIKILTALAAGVPVVSTRLGIEGLGLKENKTILLAEEAEDFAESVVRLAEDSCLAKEISTNGIKFINKNFNPAKQKETLKRIFSESRVGSKTRFRTGSEIGFEIKHKFRHKTA